VLEVSIVPVPANQDALRLAYKGLDADIVKDIEDVLALPPEEDVEEDEIAPVVTTEEPVVEEKSGRVISQKNKKMLEATADSLRSALSEIEKLLAEGVTTTEEDVEGKDYVVVPKNLIDDLKFMLRGENRNNDKILSTLKNI
jgi:hypothetical protein